MMPAAETRPVHRKETKSGAAATGEHGLGYDEEKWGLPDDIKVRSCPHTHFQVRKS